MSDLNNNGVPTEHEPVARQAAAEQQIPAEAQAQQPAFQQVPVQGQGYAPYQQVAPMNAEEQKIRKRLKNGRASIMIIAVLTGVNMILLFFQSGWRFTFSMIIPDAIMGVSTNVSYYTGSNGAIILGLIAGVVLVGIFFALYFLSKKYAWPGIVALVLFSIDTIVLAVMLIGNMELIVDFLIYIVFHVWAVVSLASLVGASYKAKELNIQE